MSNSYFPRLSNMALTVFDLTLKKYLNNIYCVTSQALLKFKISTLTYYAMPFPFLYRTVDLSLCYLSCERAKRNIKCPLKNMYGIVGKADFGL